MAKEYKEVALTKEGAQALVRAMSEANAKVAGSGKATAKRPRQSPRSKTQ